MAVAEKGDCSTHLTPYLTIFFILQVSMCEKMSCEKIKCLSNTFRSCGQFTAAVKKGH